MKILVKKLLAKTGYVLINVHKLTHPQRLLPLKIKHFLDLYFSRVDPKTFFFLQIGAADGKVNDPIYEYATRYNLRGVAVEPQLASFKNLQENYKGYPVTCLQAAVADKTGTVFLWGVKKDSGLYRGDAVVMAQKASFNKEIVKKTISKKLSRGADPEQYVESVEVQALSFSDLVKEASIEKIDLLQIDAEGYDWEILKTVDFARFKPEVINFESFHFSDETRGQCENLLKSKGYKFFRYGGDTCAYRV